MLLVALSFALAAPDDALTQARAANRAGDAEAEATACATIPDVPACRTRLTWIDARRDVDGGLQGLLALEAVRRDPNVSGRRERVEELAKIASSQGLRAEIAVWLARDDLADARPAAALAALDAVSSPPEDLRPTLGLLRAEAAAELGLPGGQASRQERLVSARRVVVLRALSAAVIGAFVLIAGGRVLMGLRRAHTESTDAMAPKEHLARRPRGWPKAMLALTIGLLLSFLLAAAWDASLTWSAAGLLPALIALHALAGAGQVGLVGPGRTAMGVLAALATLATGWVMLQPLGVLDPIGLGG